MEKRVLTLLLFSAFLLPSLALARVGVGVGTGKIVLDEELRSGGVYELPAFTVLNTGDETSDYQVGVAYHSQQQELKPEKGWFTFTPQTFSLEHGKGQIVNVELSLPIKTTPGNYFAYLEGRPVKKVESSEGASIGVAAAAKLYFTVAPANFFQGVYYRLMSLVNNSAPWSYIILAVIVVAVLITVFKKKFNFKISIDKK